MKKILLLSGLLCFAGEIVAQKTLYLKPFIGAQSAFTGYGKGSGKSDFLHTNGLHVTDNFGLLLEMPLNSNLILSAGWYKGDIGWSFDQSFESKTDANQRGGVIWSNTTAFHRFPVTAKVRLGEAGWGKSGTEGVQHKNAVRFYGLGGLSFDHLPHGAALTGSDTTAWGFSSGDRLTNIETVKGRASWGTAAVVGLGTQVFSKGRPRLDLTLFYSHGLRKMLQIDLHSDLNGQPSFTRIYSRGSMVGVTLGYPIRLKTFNKKEG